MLGISLRYAENMDKKLKILSFIGIFPAISESWFVEQTTGLLDKEVEIDIVAFRKSGPGHISEKIKKYHLMDRVTYIEFPENRVKRFFLVLPLIFKMLLLSPAALGRALNVKKLGKSALALKYIFWTAPLLGKTDQYDVIHCHFGMVANRFLVIRDILGIKQKFITTFYGQDSSKYIQAKGLSVYDRLKRESSYILLMTNEMKDRLVSLGFPEHKLLVHYTGVNTDQYDFRLKSYDGRRIFNIVSVGRLVPKKGFDDLLRAAEIISRSYKNFKINIVGDGERGAYLRALADRLGISGIVEFKGMMPHRETLKFFAQNDIIVQLSKTAPDGDTDDLPFVLLEGQISGLPAVTTNHVGIPDGILNGKTGFLVPEGDYVAAAEKIMFLIQNPNVMQEFSGNAHRFVKERFDLNSLNNKLIELYTSLR